MKKALSVFLSLLMVITTISVVFTLPASAVGVTLYSEDFEGFGEGDKYVSTKYLPSGNGWMATAYSYNTVQTPTEEVNGFTTSEGKIAAVQNWTAAMYVFDVEPNTTYTVGADFWQNSSRYFVSNSVRYIFSATDITGIAEGTAITNGGKGVLKVGNVSYTATTKQEVLTSDQWVNTTLSFTTGANSTKYAIVFENQNNDKVTEGSASASVEGNVVGESSAIFRCLYIDNVLITYDAKPTVKTITYGADNKNGGVAWVDSDVSTATEGMSVTYKAMPYESSLFDGWYVNGNKVSTELTYTQNSWALNDVVEAKFEALTKNYFEDGSGENAIMTAGSSAPDKYTSIYKGDGGNGKAWSNGSQTLVNTILQHKNANSWEVRTASRTISADNWVGSSYGGISTNNNAYIDSMATGVTAYSGKSVYNVKQSAHSVYKVVRGLEKNTDYIVTYYIYQYGSSADFNAAYAITGIATNATAVYMSDGGVAVGTVQPLTTETVVNAWGEEAEVVTGQTSLTQSYIVDGRATLGEWTKHSVTFNTGDYNDVLVNFYSAKGTFIDHICLYSEPEAVTPTVSSESNFGSNDGIVYDVTDAYYEGDTFQATAMPYDNATFVGFYVDDVKVESGVTENANGSYTALLTYNAGKTYTAKFSALTENLFEDGSGENAIMTAGSSAPDKYISIYKGDGGSGKAWSNGSQTLVNTVLQHSGADNGNVRTTSRTISADNWVGSSFGGIATNNNAYIDSMATGVTAYSGKSVYNVKQASHSVYKVVRGLEKNTDYIVTYYIYQYGSSADFNNYYAITGIATNATAVYMSDGGVAVGTVAPSTKTEVTDKWGVEDDVVTGQTSLTQSYIVDGRATLGAWTKHSVTFNTGDYNDVLVNFYSAQGTFIDHISLYEQPVTIDLEALVQVDKGGYNNVGLVQTEGEVYTDGDEFTIAATPYANATLDGLYVDGEKVENGVVKNLTTTYEVTYKAGSTYVVKFNAFAENIFPDTSLEGITPSASTKFINSPAASVKNAENPILSNGWMASVCGHAYVATGSQLSSIQGFENVTAYAGNNVLYTECASHQVYRLLNVEANSNYKMIYYVYAPADAKLNVNYVYGIKAEGDTVTWADMNPKFGGETGQSQIAVTVNDYAAAAGQWVKREVTFNTGAHTRVLIPFGSTPILFDHVTVYRLPNPTTVSIGVAGGNLVVGDKYASTLSYELGEQVTVTAVPYANTGNTFLGWYTDASCTDEAFSTKATLSVTATDGGTYFAKFKNNSIVADSGFENLAIGEITSQGATTGFYTSNAKIYVTDTVVNHDNLSAYAGNNMLKVKSAGGTVYYNVGAVEPYTSYIVSFKVLLPEEGQEVSDWRDGSAKIVGFAGVRSIDARIGDASLNQYKDIVPINGNQYEYEEDKITYHTIEGEDGNWKQVTAIVNSYEFDELKIGFGYNGTTSTGVDISMYVDDFTVVEAVNATASVETLNPFGDEASAQVGGYAYAKNSYTQAAISGSGNATGVTLVATPVNGGVFLGWYQGENKVSSETTYECEITEATSFVAKFAYNGFEDVISSAENLLTFDGSFEEYEAGALVISGKQPIGLDEGGNKVYEPTSGVPVFNRGSENFTLGAFSEWGKIFATTRYAYDGSNSLYLNTDCNASFIMKLGESGTPSALETNTKYVLSFYYFYPKSADYNDDGKPDFYIQQIGIVEEGFDLKGSAAISSYLDSKEDANGKKLLYGASHQGATVYGEWTKVEIPFTTTETAGATLSLTATAGTKNTEQRIYLDKFELKKANVYETAASTAFNNSVERGGVAIRVPNAEGTVTQALRFKARIAKERLEAMTLGANYTVVEYGSLAMNAAYIEGANDIEKANNLTIGYTNRGKNVVKGVTYNADKGTNRVFAYKQGEKDLIFTAALTGIGKNMEGDNLAKAYKTDYIVRTYAILRLADGTEVTVYDTVDEHDTFSASVYAIAKRAVDDPEVDQTTKTYLQEQIIDICKAAPEEGVASSYTVFYNAAGAPDQEPIANYFVDENITINGDRGTHASRRPVYYSSDKTIRNYTGNTLTLSAKEGYYISSVVITTTEDEPYAATTSTGVATTEGTTTTIEGINSAEFVLTATAKMFITGITVNYKYGVAPDPIIPEEPDPEDPEEPVHPNTTVVIADYALANNWSNSEQYTTIKMNDYITVTANGGGNTGKYYESGYNWRIYQGESGTVTITGKRANIISVKVTYTVDKTGILTLGGVNVASDEVVTVNAKTVTFGVGNTGSVTNGQVRITNIEVVYDIIEICETHTYTDNCDAICDVCDTQRDVVPHDDAVLCDTVCSTCGATVEATANHTVDNGCDTNCNDCGAAVIPTHEDDDILCDTVCGNCDATVEATADHVVDNGCDTDCNDCGAAVTPTHEDDDILCNTVCDNCGAAVEATADHVYDDDNDAICNNCGFERVLESQCDHTADAELCDTTCSVCGADVEATEDHTYTNACDTTCDVCDTAREQAHVDTILCDTVCSTCGATVEATADHAYTDNCDADCNNCGAIRTVTHDDAVLCDTTCSNCGATVEATAEHNYVDGVCDACGAEKPTSTTTTINAETAGIAASANVGTHQVDEVITIIGEKGTHSNSQPVYNSSSKAFRCYQGNLFTIKVADGYIIESIIITTDASYKMSNATISSGTMTGETTTTATITGINASEFIINCSANRVYIKTITVVYKVPCTHEYDDDCDANCNLCDEAREVTHADDVLCDETCSNCGAAVEATADHVYDDENDAICNNCGFERVLESQCDHAADAQLCDTTCSVCGADVEATADHTWTNACDTNCDVCDTAREQDHVDTILCDTVCSTCGAEVEATAEHNYVDGACDACGAEEVSGPVATFTLGADGTATHKDGTSNKTSYTETDGNYTLNLTNGANMYPSSIDAKGNGAIKLGASSKAGGFSFEVPDEVNKVVIYVGQYKANTTKVTINGTTYTISGASNNGEYDAIEIDTSTTKTVTLTTVSGGYRAMVNTIEFWA